MNCAHLAYEPGVLRLLDQSRLPAQTVFLQLRSCDEVADAIATMRVRGAPAIGITAAYGLAIEAHSLARSQADDETFLQRLSLAATKLAAVRPTAVNLSWATGRMIDSARRALARRDPLEAVAVLLDSEAERIHTDDVNACRRIGALGAGLLDELCARRERAGQERLRLLTHCNTGDLATGGYGTALGIVRAAWSGESLAHVFVDETRPLLQGARLTAWELERDRIPFTLITDSMAAHFMQRGDVDAVVVGADRIAANGDTANKIGTYGLALAARAHGLPFLVAAPISTLDMAIHDGSEIVIEQRSPKEVTSFAGIQSAPVRADAANPAFDLTPAHLISAIVTERGVARPPQRQSLSALVATVPESASV